MIYKVSKGSNNNVLVTLHGTGGEADQLFSLAKELDADATLLGIQGSVNENGMNRYFERYPDGNYNFESLDNETEKLYQRMMTLLKELGYHNHNLYILGYSNGANMIVNMLRKYRLKAKGVLIFHPATMRMEMPYLRQEGVKAFISSGKEDPYFSDEAMRSMRLGMEAAVISVETYLQDFGHQLTHDEIEHAKIWFDKINTDATIFRDFRDLDTLNQRKLVNGSVVPRPIAWVSTRNEDDSVNLAPFSYYNIVAADMLSVSFIPQGDGKDTLVNILRTHEAVINSVSIKNLPNVTLSSHDYDYMVSEAEIHDIEMVPSTFLKTPSVKEAYVSFETKLFKHFPILDSEGNKKADLVLLKIMGANFRDGVLDDENNYVDIDILNPGSRLAGVSYGNTKEEKSVKRD